MADLTEQTEEAVSALANDLLRQHKLVEDVIPRPPFSVEAPREVKLQRLDQSFNPGTMSSLRKVYGRKQLVRGLLEGGLLAEYLQRKAADAAQSPDSTSTQDPATTVGPEGSNGRIDGAAGG